MRRATLADLKTRALRMADTPADSTSRSDAIIIDAELTDIANDKLAELHDIVVQSDETYLLQMADVYTIASQRYTYLPDDFFKLKKLLLHDSGTRNELERLHLNDLDSHSTTDTTTRPAYKLMSDRLWWHPLPAGAYRIELWYTRQFHPLVDALDELDPIIPRGWEAFVVAGMAEYILSKQELDPRAAIKQMEQARDRITRGLKGRESGPIKIRDVNNRFGPKHPRHPRPRE